MLKTPNTVVDIHPLLSERWSPRSFDAQATMSDVDVLSLLEAARWAPSANNSQPWRIAVVRRDDSEFQATVETLAGFNKLWAPRASAFFVVGIEHTDADNKARKWAEYDTGIASALLTTQAHALGWHVHQMGGFNPEELHSRLGFNDRTKLITVIAVGRLARADQLTDELLQRETAERQRNELKDIVVHGLPL